jgi:hypothetical protein
MRTVSAALIFAATLSSCTMVKPESWAKQIFAPSSGTDQRACDEGFAARSNPQASRSFGYVALKPPVGKLSFFSRIGFIHLRCRVMVAFDQKPSGPFGDFTYVSIEDSSVTSKQVKVQISLEANQNEVFRLTDLPIISDEVDRIWYAIDRRNENLIKSLETVTSFTIIVNRGAGEERYFVNPTNLPGL